MKHLVIATTVILLSCCITLKAEDDPIFSGPQVGEKLVAFKTRGVLGREKGKELDFVKAADGKPIVMVFLHKLTRPSVGMTRVLMNYVATRKKDGLQGGIVWLADDIVAAEERINRAKHALPKNTSLGLSLDGFEGPGAYGLNRDVTLTVLVGEKGKVTANYALVQPSIQADLPKILKSIVGLVGGKVPSLMELGAQMRRPVARPAAKMSPEAEQKLRALIQKENKDKDTEKIAAELEAIFKKDKKSEQDVASRARRIVDAGVVERYGTAKAQEYLKKWAKLYKPPVRPKKIKDKKPTEDKKPAAPKGDEKKVRQKESD